MGIKITKGDTTIEVDTEDELKMVLNVLGTVKKHGPSIRPSDFAIDTDTLIAVYKEMPTYSKAHKVLYALRGRPDGMTTQELVKELELDKEQALGGVLGSIKKYAEPFGVDIKEIYKWTVINDKGVYVLTEKMAEVINTLGNEGEA
jgi:hypothetical protein